MKKTDRIFIAGHKGLVGSSVFKTLKDAGFNNLITINRKKLDKSFPPNDDSINEIKRIIYKLEN